MKGAAAAACDISGRRETSLATQRTGNDEFEIRSVLDFLCAGRFGERKERK
jgi:hypothetical protein